MSSGLEFSMEPDGVTSEHRTEGDDSKGMTTSGLNISVTNTSAIGVQLLRVSPLCPLLCWPCASTHLSHFYGVFPLSRDAQASKTVFILFF